MSTNYYIHFENEDPIHIGLQSHGWQFLFNVHNRYQPNVVDSYDGWMSFLDIGQRKGGEIRDEYGRPVKLSDLKAMIFRNQCIGVNGWTADDVLISDWMVKQRQKGEINEVFCRKGFRFSTAHSFG